jgi:hypothetical protein
MFSGALLAEEVDGIGDNDQEIPHTSRTGTHGGLFEHIPEI